MQDSINTTPVSTPGRPATSKMKGRSLSILGIVAAAAGTVMLMFFKSISVLSLTIGCGVLFMVVGLINLIFFGAISKHETHEISKVLTLITNAAAIVLGICMIVFQIVFGPMIAFMFGLLVAVCALWQFFVLAVGSRPHQLPAWLYLFPAALCVMAVYIFILRDNEAEFKLMLATGIAMATLGAGCIIEGVLLGMARRRALRGTVPQVETTEDLDDEIKQ